MSRTSYSWPGAGVTVSSDLSLVRRLPLYPTELQALARPQTVQGVADAAELVRAYCESRPLAPRTKREYRKLAPLVEGVAAERAAVRAAVRMVARRAPVHANRLLQVVRAACRWGVGEGMLAEDPTVGLRKTRETPRSRVLGDAEVVQLVSGLQGRAQAIVVSLVLLGQRLGETLRVGDVSRAAGGAVWEIPKEVHKGRRGHVVPLSEYAAAMVVRVGGGGAANPGRLRAAAKRALPSPPAVPWVLHDLRRTCATGCARLGAAPHVVERVLGHAEPALRRTYNLWSGLDEVRAALEAWERHLRGLPGWPV